MKRRHVGDRAERDKIEQCEQVWFLAGFEEAAPAQSAHSRNGEQEGDAHGGKMAMRGCQSSLSSSRLGLTIAAAIGSSAEHL